MVGLRTREIRLARELAAKTCAKCDHCRVVVTKPTSIDSAIVSKMIVKRIYCAKDHFPHEFTTLTHFSTSSVRRRAESCGDFSPEDDGDASSN